MAMIKNIQGGDFLLTREWISLVWHFELATDVAGGQNNMDMSVFVRFANYAETLNFLK